MTLDEAIQIAKALDKIGESYTLSCEASGSDGVPNTYNVLVAIDGRSGDGLADLQSTMAEVPDVAVRVESRGGGSYLVAL